MIKKLGLVSLILNEAASRRNRILTRSSHSAQRCSTLHFLDEMPCSITTHQRYAWDEIRLHRRQPRRYKNGKEVRSSRRSSRSILGPRYRILGCLSIAFVDYIARNFTFYCSRISSYGNGWYRRSRRSIHVVCRCAVVAIDLFCYESTKAALTNLVARLKSRSFV